MKIETDIVIVGTGIAALAQALKISADKQVLIITKDKIPSTNSAMAQGGIAAVIDKTDSFSDHIEDT